MADDPQNQQGKPGDGKAPQPMFWLAFAALFGMLLLAIVALMMASKNSSVPQITITNASNNKEERPVMPQPVQVAAPAAPTPIGRPDKSVDPDAHRMSGQMAGAPQQLPGALATPTIVAGRRDGAALPVRADPNSPPYYATLSPSSHVKFRLRGLPGGPSHLNGPVPFRVHAWEAGTDGRVSAVEASVPGSEDPERYSYLPETKYRASKGRGRLMGITVSRARKTSVVNDLRAPKGFQFLVADISAKNLSKDDFSVDPDMFEIQDSDRVPYLPNPELLSADFPQSPIAPQASGKFTAAFLVPADASLTALVAREPGDGLISSPLNPQ